MNRTKTFLGVALSVGLLTAQNVGIGTSSPHGSARLHVYDTQRGVLIPNVSLSAQNSNSPIVNPPGPALSLLVYNNATAGSGANAVSPGYYYWNGTRWVRLLTATNRGGDAWLTTGNDLINPNTNFIGTINNVPLIVRSNNVERMRITPDGEVIVGGTAPVLEGDLLISTSLSTLPWAVNGYAYHNGGGVYGAIMSGNTTIFAAVQGENQGTNTQGAGVRGSYMSTTSGTNFFPNVVSGVAGTVINITGNYKFGVYGAGGFSTRSGGVLGADYNAARGALGYYASNGQDYAVYGFGQGYTVGGAGGRMANPLGNFNNTIGLGIYGGVMGGWIKGLGYGLNVAGERYGLYVHGKTITNDVIATLHAVEGSDTRVATYALSGMRVEIMDRGRGKLESGRATITFDNRFSQIVSAEEPIIITVTPIGPCKGLYVESSSPKGFTVVEMDGGSSSVEFNWIAIGVKKASHAPELSPEILSKSFEEVMNGEEGIMYNDENPKGAKYVIWWDGKEIRFDGQEELKARVKQAKKEASRGALSVTRMQPVSSENADSK